MRLYSLPVVVVYAAVVSAAGCSNATSQTPEPAPAGADLKLTLVAAGSRTRWT